MAIKPPLSQYLCLTPILSAFPAGMFTAPAPTEGAGTVERAGLGLEELQPILQASNISFPYLLIAWVPVPPHCQ